MHPSKRCDNCRTGPTTLGGVQGYNICDSNAIVQQLQSTVRTGDYHYSKYTYQAYNKGYNMPPRGIK